MECGIHMEGAMYSRWCTRLHDVTVLVPIDRGVSSGQDDTIIVTESVYTTEYCSETMDVL